MNKRVAVRFGFVAVLLLWIVLTQLASADDLVSLYLPLIANGGYATPSSTPTRTAPSSPTPTSTASATPTLPASTPTATATQTTTPGPCAGNGIVRSVWTGISGSTVNDLIVGTNNFSLAPTVSDVLPSFEAPANWNDNYGTLMTAWLCVPITSTYRFWIASDDNSSLLFNTTVITDLSTVNIALIAAGATEIAFVSGWTNSREWNKYPEQQSSPFALPPGWYYLEARHKEAVGGDNLAVAWREGTPAPPANGDGSFIIPQAHLYVIVGFSGTTDTPTPTATHTVTATSTPTGTATRTPTPTGAIATPTPTNTATRTPSLTPNANCVTGILDVSLNPNALQILFTNSAMPPINRRLMGLSISWSGAQMITSLSFGNAGNLIWVGGSAGGSLVLGESDWQSSNRTILTGTSRPLTINFDQSAFPGNYTLSATWDDGAGGNLCTSPAVNTP